MISLPLLFPQFAVWLYHPHHRPIKSQTSTDLESLAALKIITAEILDFKMMRDFIRHRLHVKMKPALLSRLFLPCKTQIQPRKAVDSLHTVDSIGSLPLLELLSQL